AIADMFCRDIDMIYVVDDRTIERTVRHLQTHQIRGDFGPNLAQFTHPHHINTTRTDDFTNLEGVSQANMYAHLLRLPINASLAQARVRPEIERDAEHLCRELGFVKGKTVVLFPDANSWQQIPDEFWSLLPQRLADRG